MREARARGGVDPDGEALVSYHSPGVQREAETSLEEWKNNDPLPLYQDRVIGYTLVPPLVKLRLPAARNHRIGRNNHSTHHLVRVAKGLLPWHKRNE